jgi:cell wall-associated NlpC family hydrolase
MDTTTLSILSPDRFVGIPWKDKGRDSSGCDCWGLVRIVYQEILGINLPNYGEDYSNLADKKELAALIGKGASLWKEVKEGEEEVLDLVLLRQSGLPIHVGVVIGRGLMLHVPTEQSSTIVSYRGLLYKKRVDSFYRYNR